MSLLLASNSGGSSQKEYVDSLFSTYLYTGNGSTQTINNGIDLAGKGGLVWIKARNLGDSSVLGDTARGIYVNLSSNIVNYPLGFTGITSVNSNGFTLDSTNIVNAKGYKFSSWTFRKAPKFFDVMTYTGDNLPNRHIPHSLGIEPGMIIVRASQDYSSWSVYHRSLGPSFRCILNEATASSNFGGWGDTSPTSTEFTVNNYGGINGGGQHLAYLFAHDTSPDGIVQCGSYIGNGSATGPEVTLGWEPQYLMIKNASGTGNWQIIDNMRGMPVGSADATLQANLSNTESSVDYVSPTATGFQVTSASSEVNTSGSTYIYMAIRRPNKPPTSGTQVFDLMLNTSGVGSSVPYTAIPDLVISKSAYSGTYALVEDRLRKLAHTDSSGASKVLYTQGTDSENTISVRPGIFELNSVQGTRGGSDGGSKIFYMFRRAPGFFDMVCYTGTGAARTVNHNLGVAPELIVIKERSGADAWYVEHAFTPTTWALSYLNYDSAASAGRSYDTVCPAQPTTSVFSLGTNGATNQSGATYIAYLFATKQGISKVGSYTGNGSSQTINCGFAAGARFILIKRTDSAGDWYVWSSATGIVAANDPHLSLNTSAGEVTTDDSVDPESSGFIVNQVAATNINVSGGSYIFLAIA